MLAKNISALGGSAVTPTYVDDVFSTYLYNGNGSTQTINNGIDLAGKGGMVWTKVRNSTWDHGIHDTTRGAGYDLRCNSTFGQYTDTNKLSGFTSTGYTIGSAAGFNQSGDTHVSWTFRKAPKFFDVVTYTGNGGGSNILTHSLGVVPGMIICKATSTTSDWGGVSSRQWWRNSAPRTFFKWNCCCS